MHRNQRHQQAIGRTECHDYRRHQSRHHDVVGRGRQTHTEDQTDDGGEDQHQQQITAGDELHELGHYQPDTRQRDGTDNDTSRCGGNTDTHHVAGAGHQRMGQIDNTLFQLAAILTLLVEERLERALSNHDEDHEHRRPECGQLRREALNGQTPDQDHHRKQEIEPGLDRWANRRQFAHRLLGIIFLQSREAGRVPDQPDVSRKEQRREHPHGRCAQPVFHPANAVIDHQGQNTQPQQDHYPVQHALGQGWPVQTLNALHIELAGLKMNDVDQGDIGNHRGQDRVLDHLKVGNTHVLHHQEGRGPHNRRSQLTVSRSSDFNRARLGGRETHPLHQRNGKGTGGDHVGNGGTGNHATEATGYHGCLGRSATHVSQQRIGHLDEVVTGTCPFEQSTKQHKQEHEAGRDAQRHAKHAFSTKPLVRCQLAQTRPFVRDNIRHVGAGQGINDEYTSHDGQW